MKNKDIHFVDNVINALKKSATELEEFQVQAALGKAEAKENYEEVKKKFNQFIHDSEFKVKGLRENIDELHTKFDELRVQLALGKAETKDIFKKQKKQLLSTLHDIEVKIKTNDTLQRMYAITLIEMEQFKIQLEMLEQKFNKKDKTEAKNTFEKGKKDFNTFINKLRGKYIEEKEESRFEHFQSEISEAFDHFKKAFSKS